MSNGLSLRELGRRTGVTASLLSQIENGKSDPSFSTLSALVSELGLSLDAMLRSEWPALEERQHDRLDPRLDIEPNGVIERNGTSTARGSADQRDQVSSGHHGSGGRPHGADGGLPRSGRPTRGHSPVIRPPERQTLDLDSGVVWERLTRGTSELLDVLLVTYEPGATSSSSGRMLRHSGIEHAYLMSGELTLKLGFETYVLRAGDSLEFDGSTPHVYCNQGDVPARGLWSVLGRDNQPVRPRPHRLLELTETGPHRVPSAVDFLQVFSRD
jgi:transcriptional regulator with XRE-family HTH domain/quercetin dioxygenase-like cupin family protein